MLIEAVRDVAEASGQQRPERISTRAWDAARPSSQGHSDAPPARRICECLGLGWAKVREIAFMPANAQRIALGRALNERQGSWLTEAHGWFALMLVARRLGLQTLTPGQYRVERSKLLAARRSHRRELRLPTDEQIAAVAGSWKRALAGAGLQPRPASFAGKPRVPATTAGRRRSSGLPC